MTVVPDCTLVLLCIDVTEVFVLVVTLCSSVTLCMQLVCVR